TTSRLGPDEEVRALLGQNRPEAALPLLEKLHKERPDDLEIARELVDAKVKTGQVAPLIQSLKAELARKASATNDYMLGLAQFAQSATVKGAAREAFERAIALAPKNAELHYRLGVALLESEEEKEALGPLETTARLEPHRTRVRLPLAKARLR